MSTISDIPEMSPISESAPEYTQSIINLLVNR